MAKIDGIVSEAGTLRSKKRLLVTNEESGQVEEHSFLTASTCSSSQVISFKRPVDNRGCQGSS